MLIRSETMGKGLADCIALAEEVLEAAACIPAVTRHPLSAVIDSKLCLSGPTIVPACEFL